MTEKSPIEMPTSPSADGLTRRKPTASSASSTAGGSSQRARGGGAAKKASWRIPPGYKLLAATAIGLSTVFYAAKHSPPGSYLKPLYGHMQTFLDGFDLNAPAAKSVPYEIEAPDGSIRATVIDLGASLQSVWVPDRQGIWRDVVLGYDDTDQYFDDPNHPYMGSIVGRYANRIKNGTFALPPQRNMSPDMVSNDVFKVYKTTRNENGRTTLHGGRPGYDRRPWQKETGSQRPHAIVFKMSDYAGEQGFPGRVDTWVEYEALNDGKLSIRIDARTDKFKTPLSLSSHVYWNLDGYRDDASAKEHQLRLPSATQYVETDSDLIPTGQLVDVKGTPYDFTKAKKVGAHLGRVGAGYDTCFIAPERSMDDPIVEMWSEKSGIKLSLKTNQPAVQIYTCNGIKRADGSLPPIPRKASQGGPGAVYDNHSCVVIEPQQPIDAINNPQWGYDVVYGPGRKLEWQAVYEFSTL